MVTFEWNEQKDIVNQQKHGVSFKEAERAFKDRDRLVVADVKHSSSNETRYFCLGKVADKIMTVRFTYRQNRIRIIGAGYWREGKVIYEKNRSLHECA